MQRVTTTEAFMRGFFKVAYENGLSMEEAADLHSMAIINEARLRSPEFAEGFDKAAAALPWYHPGRWFGANSQATPERRKQPSYTPTAYPVSDEHRSRHADQFVQEQQTARGKTQAQAQQSASNVMRGRNAIHQSSLQRRYPESEPSQMSGDPVPPKIDLKGGALGALHNAGDGPIDFKVRTPVGVAGARG